MHVNNFQPFNNLSKDKQSDPNDWLIKSWFPLNYQKRVKTQKI